MFRKVTIIGVGLIGGSIGLAIKKHKLAREVVGLSQKQSSLMTALKSQAIDHAYQDVRKAVSYADFVILATPVSIIKGMLSTIGPFLKKHCIVTDVGSTKSAIVATAHNKLKGLAHFVGSHPLAGSEKTGVQYANAELFQNSLCIMTPTDKTNRTARERVKYFWTRIGSHVKFLSPEEHDRALGFISHLPHLLAYGLIDIVPKEYLEYAAGGLKDTTRIASSSAQMWSDICLSNSKNIIAALDLLVKKLSSFRRLITVNDHKLLLEQFKTAKFKRDEIGGQHG